MQQRFYKLFVISLMKPYARLVENIQNTRKSAAYLRRKPYPLRFAARESSRASRKREISETYVGKEFQPCFYFFHYRRGDYFLRLG